MKRFIYTLACLVLSIGAWAQGEVAQIGETKYATLADAVAAVPTDGTETTITMLEDADITTALTIANTKNVVIDLNGKTVKNDDSKSLAQLVTVNGKLTINDSSEPSTGVIKNTASAKYVIKTGTAASVLTLNNGTIETTTGNGNGAVYGTNGSFVMTGGKIIAAGTGVTSKNVTISGGEITATAGQALCAAGTITGGKFTSSNNNAVYANQSGTLEITGGEFTGVSSKPTINIYTTDVKVSGATLNNGVGFASNATAMLLPGTDDAYLTNTQAEFYDGETLVGYAPINTGLFANNKVAGKTVKLTEDVATTTYINVTKSFTLDLNGHNIACTPAKADATILIKGTTSAPVELTIKGEGQISCADHGEGCNAIQVGNCTTLNIEGGEFSVPGDNAAIYIVNSVASNPSTVTITGGYFESGDGKWILNCKDDAYNTGGAKIVVKGGSFSADPSQFLSEGEGTNFLDIEYKPVLDSDGHYSVIARDFVAQIGDVKYETLAEAVEAAQNDETVTLLADATINEMITIADGKAVTVDMNGKNISGSSYFQVTHGKLNLTGEGTYSTSAVYALKVVGASTDQGADYSVISVGENVTVKSTHAVYGYVAMVSYDTAVKGNKSSYGAKIDFNGKGEGRLGLYVNGTIQANSGNVPEIIVGSTATVKSEEYALYAAGYANYTINGELVGEGGIEAKGGKVVVNDGAVITATSMEQSHEKNNNGTSTKGYAIVSVANTGYAGNAIEVKGGTITGTILSIDDQGGEEIATGLEVSGGSFSSVVPEKYCAPGFSPITIADADGMYTVETTKVAMVGENRYASIQEAVDAAEDGQTVKLIADVDISKTIVVDKKITLDLDGHTIYNTQDIWDGGDWSLISVRNTGDLTITGNGKLSSKADDCYAVDVYDVGAKLTIENGEFVGNLSAVYVYEGEATIKGGKYSIIQKDDQYAGEPNAFLLNCLDESRENGTATITVIGGEFEDYDPQNNKAEGPNTNVVPKEYATEKNADGNFTIIPAVAYIEKKGFKTLDAAIEEAKQAETATAITLLVDAETEKETLPANVTIDANNKVLTMPSFVVLDGQAFTLPNITGAETYKVRKATYIRTNISATQWGTVCLPFSLTNGNGADYYTYNNISGSTLTVDEVTSVAPNTPVVFHKGAGDLTINETDATVSLVTPGTLENGALVATYEDVNKLADGKTYFINSDTFHKAQVSLTVPAYRAYINYTALGEAAPRTLYIVVSGDDVTAIGTLTTDDATISAIYDATGRKISAPQKGINIMKLENGKTVKVMIK